MEMSCLEIFASLSDPEGANLGLGIVFQFFVQTLPL